MFSLPGWVTKNTGGAEIQLYLLSEELLKRGWKVEVITTSTNLPIKQTYHNSNIAYYYYNVYKLRIPTYFSILNQILKTNSAFYYTRNKILTTRSPEVILSYLKQK